MGPTRLKGMNLFPGLVKNTPPPSGFQLKVDGVIKRKVYPTQDAAMDAADEMGIKDYSIREVE